MMVKIDVLYFGREEKSPDQDSSGTFDRHFCRKVIRPSDET